MPYEATELIPKDKITKQHIAEAIAEIDLQRDSRVARGERLRPRLQ